LRRRIFLMQLAASSGATLVSPRLQHWDAAGPRAALALF
jgi:hypothetical protein